MFRKGKKRHSSSSSQGSEISTKSKQGKDESWDFLPVHIPLLLQARTENLALSQISVHCSGTRESCQLNSQKIPARPITNKKFRQQQAKAVNSYLYGSTSVEKIDRMCWKNPLGTSQSVDSSLGGLSRSSTVASLDTDSTRSSGQSNSNFDTCTEFRVKYLGAIENLKASLFECLQGPQDLINYIDLAQQYGKLPFTPSEEESILYVSKYGIKVASTDQFDILHRHPLYLIVRMICYDDGLGMGKSLLALKTTDANQNEYSICVYQCNSLEQAQTICKVLSTAFDAALSSEKS